MGVSVTSRGKTARRPHVHELDRLRIVTALSVVIVHVLMFTMYVEHSPLSIDAQNAFVANSYYTRELFMFVTGSALVYVYFGKPFNWRYVWKRRGIGVFMPYTLWSVIYTVVNNRGHPWQWYVRPSLFNFATGSASYQFYYILMTSLVRRTRARGGDR
jgi:surface polysaccharide O-acyltransferase-like enzyme